MHYTIECEQEQDGRWIAEVPDLPGVLVYGSSAEAATASAEVLALRENRWGQVLHFAK
jgi:predicted RNase H-like HicB family nuclease